MYNCSGVLGVLLGRESLANHDQIPKSSMFMRVKAFPMYGGIGMCLRHPYIESLPIPSSF